MRYFHEVWNEYVIIEPLTTVQMDKAKNEISHLPTVQLQDEVDFPKNVQDKPFVKYFGSVSFANHILILNKSFIPFKGMDNKRTMVYIGNLVFLIKELIKQKKSGVFLVGDGVILSTSEFVEYLIIASNGKSILFFFQLFYRN